MIGGHTGAAAAGTGGALKAQCLVGSCSHHGWPWQPGCLLACSSAAKPARKAGYEDGKLASGPAIAGWASLAASLGSQVTQVEQEQPGAHLIRSEAGVQVVPGAQEVDVEAPLAGHSLYLQGKSYHGQATCLARCTGGSHATPQGCKVLLRPLTLPSLPCGPSPTYRLSCGTADQGAPGSSQPAERAGVDPAGAYSPRSPHVQLRQCQKHRGPQAAGLRLRSGRPAAPEAPPSLWRHSTRCMHLSQVAVRGQLDYSRKKCM